MKWLNPRLKFDYKLSATVKQILPEILTIEEVQRMINSTENSRDRAVLSLLFDSGCRPSELVNLKIEDIIFDEEGIIVNIPVEGKKGQRRIRIVNTVNSEQSLKEWLKYHRFKSDPYSPLFYRLDRRTKDKLSIESLNKLVKKTGRRTGIEKRINSYTFRHTRATYLAKFMTEQEMKIYFGWTMGSDMVKVYVHMSCRDLDQKVLELNKKPVKKDQTEDLRQLIREELLRVLREV
jgi:integrase